MSSSLASLDHHGIFILRPLLLAVAKNKRTKQPQCSKRSSRRRPSAGPDPNATRWSTRRSQRHAKLSSEADATSLPLRRQRRALRTRIHRWPAAPSSWGPTGRSMGSTPRRGYSIGRAPLGAPWVVREVGSIWKSKKLLRSGAFVSCVLYMTCSSHAAMSRMYASG